MLRAMMLHIELPATIARQACNLAERAARVDSQRVDEILARVPAVPSMMRDEVLA